MIELRPWGIERYAEKHSKPLSIVHEKLWLETYRKTNSAEKLVGALEAEFLKMLVLMTGARRILEIGTFTGFSTLALAQALPRDGRIVSCEVDPEIAEIATRYFSETPHGSKIEVKRGPALVSLKVIRGPFDLCFIDADKENYREYYDRCVELLRSKGIIVLDKMLASGNVLNPSDAGAEVADALNKQIRNDPRVENVLLPLWEGMMLVVKL
jgi:caffeoyl-CoA O-methyltransferase